MPRSVSISHKSLKVIGIYGNQTKETQEILGTLRENGFEAEEKNRGFIAAFCGKPLIDATLTYGPRYIELIAMSVGGFDLEGRIKKLADDSGIIHTERNPQFKETLQRLTDAEIRSYEKFEELEHRFRIPLEKSFGTAHYANFLQRYKGIGQDNALKAAGKRFGIDPFLLR